jgi:hypothetical protein
MAAPETVQARRAALLLHSLSASARSEVIARLSDAESARLRPLLNEIECIGLSPSFAADLHEVPLPAAPLPAGVTLYEQVERLSAEQVASRVANCTPATIAHLLHAAEWPWKAQLLGLLSDARRVEVQARLRRSTTTLAPAALEVLYERVCLDPVAAPGRRLPERASVKTAGGASATGAEPPRSSTRLKRFLSWIR